MADISRRRRPAKQAAKDVTLIYALTDDAGEIRYIGQTCRSVEYRLYEHVRSAKSGTKWPVSYWIRKLLAEGKSPKTVVIETVPPTGDWREAETTHIALHRQGGRLLNLSDGGDGTRGVKHSSATRAAISAAAKATGRKPPGNAGRVFSAEARARMSAAHMGQSRKPTPEEVAKRTGIKHKPRTKEQIERLRQAHLNSDYVASQSHRMNLSAAASAAWARRKALAVG
jgi:hypothetical protein